MIIKKIIRKWEKRYDSLYHSGMSKTDDPGFCLNIIKKVIQDLRVHEQEIFWGNWSKHARKGQNKERRANKDE